MQASLDQQYYRVGVLQKALAYKDMTNDEREKMENELEAIQKLLAANEDALKQFQRENRKTISVPTLLGVGCFLAFGLFGLYSLIVNPY